ncbi:hypothetical protein RYX36_010148 [Vicia faba]
MTRCNLSIWDDDIDGQPPYVRKIGQETRNFLLDLNDANTHNVKICCGFSCSKILKDMTTITIKIDYVKKNSTDGIQEKIRVRFDLVATDMS